MTDCGYAKEAGSELLRWIMRPIQILFFVLMSLLLTEHIHAQNPCFGNDVAQSVLTQHNNVRRTGSYPCETILTPAVVSSGRFQRLVVRKVDGQIAAQPLYVKGVTIPSGPFNLNHRIGLRAKTNVVYVVTRKNKIYAFDADNVNQDDPRQGMIWPNPILLQDWDPPGSQQSPLFAAPLSGMDDGPNVPPCQQTHGPVGITSTPVIDPEHSVMYLVARFGPVPSNPFYGAVAYDYLVKLDITTGQELGRVLIQTPRDFPGDKFNASAQLNRPGLLLLNNVLYVAFGAPVCDVAEYSRLRVGHVPTHGWVFAYIASDLQLLDVYNTSPQNAVAGIWQSGAGLAADPQHNFVYAITGNNENPDDIVRKESGPDPLHPNLYDASRTDLGESILKLSLGPDRKFQCDHKSGGFCVTPHFTAGNWYRLDTAHDSPADLVQQGLEKNCIKLHPGHAKDWCVFGGDSDLGSGGPVVLSTGRVVGGGKQGKLYVLNPLDQAHMEHAEQGFLAAFNTWHRPGSTETTCTTSNPANEPGCAVATARPGPKPDDYDLGQAYGPNIHGGPGIWERSTFSLLYLMAEKDYLRAYRVLNTGHIVETAEMNTDHVYARYPRGFQPFFTSHPKGIRSPDGMPGGAVSVSSNGDQDGIVWVSVSPNDATNTIEPGVLMAFDAGDLAKLLWFDDDPNIYFAKFVPPTIAGGKVFRATFGDNLDGNSSEKCRRQSNDNLSCGSLVIYGLK